MTRNFPKSPAQFLRKHHDYYHRGYDDGIACYFAYHGQTDGIRRQHDDEHRQNNDVFYETGRIVLFYERKNGVQKQRGKNEIHRETYGVFRESRYDILPDFLHLLCRLLYVYIIHKTFF